MRTKANIQSLFTQLTKAIVVIATAACGNMNAAASDRILDEAAQLNASDSRIELQSERQSGAGARRAAKAMPRRHGERISVRPAADEVREDPPQWPNTFDQYVAPHTLFGAGSMALTALGKGAQG